MGTFRSFDDNRMQLLYCCPLLRRSMFVVEAGQLTLADTRVIRLP